MALLLGFVWMGKQLSLSARGFSHNVRNCIPQQMHEMGTSWGVSELPSAQARLDHWEHFHNGYFTQESREENSPSAPWTCCLKSSPGTKGVALHFRWNTGNFLELVHFQPELQKLGSVPDRLLPAGWIEWHFFQLYPFKRWWCSCAASGLGNSSLVAKLCSEYEPEVPIPKLYCSGT